MEIMMKTKQSNNSQFLFMRFEDELHQFYKNLVKMIKSKKYIPKSPDNNDELDDSMYSWIYLILSHMHLVIFKYS